LAQGLLQGVGCCGGFPFAMAQPRPSRADALKAKIAEDQPLKAEAEEDVLEVNHGFHRLCSDGSTVASVDGTALPWSRGTTGDSSTSWQDFSPTDQQGSDEHPCCGDAGCGDEHPCVWDDEAVPFELTYKEALARALDLVECVKWMIEDHLRLEVSPEVTMECDEAWKMELNNGLRPLQRAYPALAAALSSAVPRQYMSEDGDLVYLKADHLAKIAESLRDAMMVYPL